MNRTFYKRHSVSGASMGPACLGMCKTQSSWQQPETPLMVSSGPGGLQDSVPATSGSGTILLVSPTALENKKAGLLCPRPSPGVQAKGGTGSHGTPSGHFLARGLAVLSHSPSRKSRGKPTAGYPWGDDGRSRL